MTSRVFDPHVDYYVTLGVSPTASLQEIRTAYHRAALRAHPDKGGSHRWMIDVTAAWEVLGEPNRRKAYDLARRNPADPVVNQKWQQAAQEAHVRAQAYPKNSDDLESWLNRATAEVQSHPVGRVLAGMVAGLVVGGVIGVLVGLMVGLNVAGGGAVGGLTGIVVGAVIGRKQPALR